MGEAKYHMMLVQYVWLKDNGPPTHSLPSHTKVTQRARHEYQVCPDMVIKEHHFIYQAGQKPVSKKVIKQLLRILESTLARLFSSVTHIIWASTPRRCNP